ncbi:activator-dependent family glycosyltransferase [Nocardiopsis sp. ATB16-24]|uniref:activator-dependent family glycosyltransferase n=1 Tax=Nocardiopsis sp. ATB16-24 TaxID=3019555 RepID=UPI002555B1A7|nr:activator-dependent family glycosyltransferase [Nocardiopsis sp. ATB16-24]
MRVVIATQAERTHFLGLVPLAWALRAAGHEVVVAGQPELAPTVAAAGLPFAPVGRDHHFGRITKRFAAGRLPLLDFGEEDEEKLTWPHLLEGYRQVVPYWWRMVNDPMADDLVGLCRTWRPDLVVWEPTTFAGAVAARACGAAHVRFLWSLDLFARMRGLFLERMREQPAASREDPLEEWLTGLAGRYGVDFDEELVCGQATVDQVPPGLRIPVSARVPVRYLGMRFVPYNGRAVVPDWLREPLERPRLCLTLGTSSTQRFGGHVLSAETVVEALADVDAEVVATVPVDRRRGLENPPPNVRLVDYVPLHALAAASTATINQGGPGTVFTMLAHALPQLIVARPRLFDAPLLARRVAGAGAGVALEAERADPQALRGEALRLLGDPDLRRHAARLREAMLAQPAPAAMVARLERHAAERRTA